MLKEKLGKIKEIEKRAARAVERAEQKAIDIVLEAEEQAASLKKKAHADGEKRENSVRLKVGKRVDAEIKQIFDQARVEAETLSQAALTEMDSAVELIVTTITKGMVD